MPESTPSGGTELLTREEVQIDKGFNTLLWNDPVNLVEYVTMTLQRVLKVDEATAQNYMMIAHTEGKAAVFHGTKEEAENTMEALHAALLQASVEAA